MMDIATQRRHVLALTHLADRAGARDLEVGYLHDDVPIEEAAWWARVGYQGAHLTSENHASPGDAALGLATKIIEGSLCRCRRRASTILAEGASDGQGGEICRWTLIEDRWTPGCDADPIPMKGADRGDVGAMLDALKEDRG